MKIFNMGEIEFDTFFKRGVANIDCPFGNFLVCGRMGSGKSYFCVKNAYQLRHKYKIKTNMKSLSIPDKKVEYFEKIDEIVHDYEEFTLYIIDELGTRYPKNAPQDVAFYEWLQHSRKCKRLVFLIHQEYLLVPNWLRGPCIEAYTTSKIPILPLFITHRGVPTLDPNTLEWNIEPTFFDIYKRVKYISNLYNTFETVPNL